MIFKKIGQITGIERETTDTGAAGVLNYAADILLYIAVSFYLLLTGVLLPLYLPGYSRLGSEKGLFWIKSIDYTVKVLIVAICFYLFSFIVRLFTDKKTPRSVKNLFPRGLRIYPSDIWAGLFCVSVFISYLISCDRQIALFGEKGWYLGLCSYFALGIGAMVTARLGKARNLFVITLTVTSFVVCLIGIVMDCFGDVFHIEGWSDSRISTVGNINWFCGYLITVIFIAVAYFYLKKTADTSKDVWICAALLIYMIAAFYMLISQGSASAYPATCAAILALLVLAGKETVPLFKVSVILTIIAFSNLVHAMFIAAGGYLRGNDIVSVTLAKVPVALALFAVFLMLSVCLNMKIKKGREEIHISVGKIFACISAVLCVLYFVFLIINTRSTSHFLGEGMFYFNSEWGSARGATMSIGFDLFSGMTPLEKLFGKGPDNFYTFLTSGRFPVTAMFSDDYFGGARLTNAHCEPLTMLINTGIAGTVTFYGLLLYVMIRGFRKCAGYDGMRKITALACSLSILAYIINNIFSFQTAVNVSQLALAVAFGAWSVIPGKAENG